MIHKTVFISYRRKNAMTARAVYLDLRANGYDVFLDYESINSGDYEHIIFNQIAARAHLVIILTPTAVERFVDPHDLMRREIEFAIEQKRNVVPLLFESFDFAAAEPYLLGGLSLLPHYNAVEVPTAYFDAAMERLRMRFLNTPLAVVLHPTPQADAAAVEAKQEADAVKTGETIVESKPADTAPPAKPKRTKKSSAPQAAPPAPAPEPAPINRAQAIIDAVLQSPMPPKPSTMNRLTAATRFELKAGVTETTPQNADAMIRLYSEIIALNPQHSGAYNNRGLAKHRKGDLEGALRDYTEAVRLDPRDALAYNNRGSVREQLGDIEGARQDYESALRLDPKMEMASNNLKRLNQS